MCPCHCIGTQQDTTTNTHPQWQPISVLKNFFPHSKPLSYSSPPVCIDNNKESVSPSVKYGTFSLSSSGQPISVVVSCGGCYAAQFRLYFWTLFGHWHFLLFCLYKLLMFFNGCSDIDKITGFFSKKRPA